MCSAANNSFFMNAIRRNIQSRSQCNGIYTSGPISYLQSSLETLFGDSMATYILELRITNKAMFERLMTEQIFNLINANKYIETKIHLATSQNSIVFNGKGSKIKKRKLSNAKKALYETNAAPRWTHTTLSMYLERIYCHIRRIFSMIY